MAKRTQPRSALAYVQRLLEDEYAQEQLREANRGLRNVYARATRKGVQATDDRKLYAGLRRAATSVRNVGLALRTPEPPPKRRGQKLLIILVAASGAALLTRLGRTPQPPGTSSDINLATHAEGVEHGSERAEPVPTHP